MKIVYSHHFICVKDINLTYKLENMDKVRYALGLNIGNNLLDAGIE